MDAVKTNHRPGQEGYKRSRCQLGEPQLRPLESQATSTLSQLPKEEALAKEAGKPPGPSMKAVKNGNATVESAIDGMKKGAFDYLMKPCDIDVLMQKLDEAAAKKRAHEVKITEARIKEITSRRAY